MWIRKIDKPKVIEDIIHILAEYKIEFQGGNNNGELFITAFPKNLGEEKLLREMLFNDEEEYK